tara:strand:+ start:564 stop:779 length:216 start_codon:yes stop_codon:yes gene_type:complete
MRRRSKNYSCRGEKCGQYPQLSIAASCSLKADVVAAAEKAGVSISRWIRELIEKELSITQTKTKEQDARNS